MSQHASRRRRPASQRRLAWTGLITVLTLLFSLFPQVIPGAPVPTASAHNLQTRDVYAYFDQNTQNMLDTRIGGAGWVPPTALLQVGDEIGLVLKGVPRDGTTTGVGGYLDFYIPTGVTVIDAAYLQPGDSVADGITGYDKIPMKGQSPIAIGAGPIGAKVGPYLAGFTPPGTNALGYVTNVSDSAGLHRGTIAGVYGDSGIFYATDPQTAWNTWATGGGYDGNTGTSDNTLTNNSGDVVVPLNRWDGEQLVAFGMKSPAIAILDPADQRGNAPWGLASAVAGPQSGYAWQFDRDIWLAQGQNQTAARNAITIGPWQRIQYPGSGISKDQPGLISTVLGYASVDGSNTGAALPLPATASQTDATSPKVIRFSVGQTTQYVPEYAWVKLRIDALDTGFIQADGCPYWHTGAFGGDAGGDDNGKDHLWRYYEPTTISVNGCVAVGKPADRPVAKVGDIFSYKIKFYNAGTVDLTNVIVRDLLPSGVSFISAVPAQNSGPNPLVWNVGTVLRGQKFEATVTVKATGTGPQENVVTVDTTEFPDVTATEITSVGLIPILSQSKSVTPTSVAPDSDVQYTVTINNIGSGPSGSPIIIDEYLPAGITYVSKDSVVVNGANFTATTAVNTASPYSTGQPRFTVPSAINAGQSLVLKFTAHVSATATAGAYCNYYSTSAGGGARQTTGFQACVTVGGGAIGDLIYRDWNGDGARDAATEEGLPGVAVDLYNNSDCSGAPYKTATTDAVGAYLFTGLQAGNYCVKVGSGVPAGYSNTADPDATVDGQTAVTLATDNSQVLTADFGYKPVGAGSIGDLVFADQGNDGLFNGADAGIPNVSVKLYEDTNGNGVIDASDALIGTQVTSDGTADVDGDGNIDPVGFYRFRNLAEGLSYIADVDQTDPDILAYYGGSGVIQQSTVDPRAVQGLTGAYTVADFGFYKVVPGSIGDLVWYDADADDVKDAAESGLANVDVKLYQDTNGNGVVDVGEPLLGTTTTDASGAYSFNNLPAGTYVVDVIATDPDIPASLSALRDPIAVTLGTAENKTDVDFPFVQGLTKTVNKASALPGEQLTYDIYPRYFGTKLLTGVSINDAIPAGTTYVSVPPSITAGGEAVDDDDPADGIIDRVAWDLGSNSPGSVGYSGGTALCPTTQTIVADKDTYIDSNDINANYGSETTISVDSDKVFNGLVQFTTLPTLPAGAVLDRAELLLTVNSGQGVNRTVSIRKLLRGPWTEGASTNTCTTGAAWQGPNCTDDWLSASGNFGSSDYGPQLGATIAPATSGATYATVVTSAVNDWYSAPSANYGLVLLATGSDTGEVKFVSRTGAAGSQPRLKLTYRVPTAGGCSGTVSLADVADTYIQEDSGGNDNYGDATTLQALPLATRQKHALLRFDVDGIPVGATLTAATLKINVATAKAGVVSEIHRMTTPWTEGTDAATGATWLDANGTGTTGAWANVAGFGTADYNATVAGSITPGTTGFKTADVKTLVQGWQTGAFTNNGLVLLSTGAGTRAAVYTSREDNSTPSKDPVIDVSWVIPPADPTRVNTLSAGPLLVVEGDTITVKMVLENRTATAVTGVTPGSLTVTAGGSGAYSCAPLTGPTPASQTVPANGSATFTWSCTTGTTPTLPGTLTFSATASDGGGGGGGGYATAVFSSQNTTNPANALGAPDAAVARINAATPNSLVLDLGSTLPQNTVITLKLRHFLAGGSAIPVADVDSGTDGTTFSSLTTFNPSSTLADYSYTVTQAGGARYLRIRARAVGGAAGDQNIDVDAASFSGGGSATTWTSASSESVIVTPPLEFKATVKTPPGVSVATNQAIMSLAFPATEGAVCYVMADGYGTNDVDYLRQVDRATGVVTPATPTAAGTQSIEAMAWSLDFLRLYAVNANQLGTLDTATGLFTARASTIASTADPLQGEFGAISAADVDGISFDPVTGVMYGVHRRETTAPSTLLDVLIKIDPVTGRHINNAFGTGVDYVKIDTSALAVYDVDDISFDPVSGALYAIANGTAASFSTGDRLVTINKTTGAVTDIARITKSTGGVLDDVEGLSFYGDGALFATTGYHSAAADVNKLWYLDKSTAVATERAVLGTQLTYNDYEAVACQGGSLSTDTTPSNEVQTGFTASIGDFVWSDVDGDGIQDPGEPGLAGIEVCASPDGGATTYCDTTDATGAYRIYGLENGTDYDVTLTPATIPTGYGPTTPATLTVTATTAGTLTADFGLRPPGTASIGDTVWLDADNDGVQDADESGLPSVTVRLYIDQNNDGVVDGGDTLLQTTTTDADGLYHFLGLHPDDYLVQVDTASSVTSPYDGTTTIAAAMTATTGTTNPRDVTITTAGQTITDADFGYNWAGSIGDYVWWDDDTEGDQDEAEPVANAFVMLYFDANGNGVIDQLNGDYQIAGMLTGADGKYLFEDLPPGNYLVDVYEDSLTTGGVRDVVPTTANVVAVPLAAGQDVDTADFGYYRGALVQGHVFWDEDRNGGLDPSEQDAPHLLENVTVDIRCAGVDGVLGNGDDFTDSADTDADGYFKFIVPASQVCTLTYAQGDIPAAYGDATTPASYTFFAQGGEDWHPVFDFGVDNSGAVGDFVWNDTDGDGVQDTGEPGIEGVTVHLCTASPCDATTAIASLATDADGRYLFEGLPDGIYYVAVDSATLPDEFVQTYDSNAPTTDNQSSVTVTGGDTFLDEDFGYRYLVTGQSTYTIAGAIWDDTDGDGVRDAGEAGIPGVEVILNCGADGTFVLTTTGVVSGPNWSLGNLPDGATCTVTVDETTLPSLAYHQTGDPDVTSPPACTGAACDATTVATVSPDDLDNNFGYQQLFSSISGTVCEATDGDGLCEAGEGTLAGATVTLTFAGPDGILGTGDDTVTTQTTGADGAYSFTGLQPGLYQVSETNPFGYSSMADRDGGNPDNISVVLGLNQAVVTRDFEDMRPAQVSGIVFEDLNLDGDRDPGEPPITNVPVTLRDSAGVAIATVNTNALGYYEFTDLLPGSYRITEANLATYTSTGDADGATNGVDRIDVTLAAGDNLTQRNFGDVRPGSIAGVVFEDLNNNGVQDTGENPLPNVQVCASPDGGVTTYCDTTDASGAYLIPNLPPDDYVVTETDPVTHVSTTPNTVPVSVGSNEAVTGVNYGDEPPVAGTHTITGTVCVNVNGDGVCDANEAPLPGVTVKLYDSTGVVLAATTTDALGDYLFVNVPDGSYSVVETDPLHYVSVNDADGGVDNTIAVPVAGADVTGRDFIDAAQTGGLAGTVYEDLNRNGQYDTGEPGIPGVIVYLDTDNDGVKDTGEPSATTDANGDYAFPDLAPGDYVIRELDPAGYLSTGDVDGPNDNKIVATVPPGVTVTDQDFGDVALGSISGTVWDDTNLNGIQDGGEAGIPNVLVCAVPVAGGDAICDTTDATGAYTLPNVPPGDYTIVEADPTGYVSTTPNTVPTTVASGEDVTGLNFGDVPPNPALGSISGTVCVNVDGDGVCDPNEAPLAGVTVELWLVGGGSPLRTTTTDAYGDYLFPNLPPGTYRVEEVNLPNYTSVNDADGLGNGADAILPIPINGNAVTDRDFVDTPVLGSLSGKVCDDVNRDGVCGAEPVLNGVTVNLYDSDGNLVATQTTVSGNYLFNNLPPGDYTVVEVDPTGYESTGDVYGVNDNIVMATVPAGGSVTNRDFADGQEPGAITGVVYNDLNGDGNFDPGEPGIANAEVCLTPAGGGAATCTTTNAGGQYAFTGLAPGNYTVTETDPSGYVSTGDADGPGNGDNTITPITVTAGEVVVDRDFFDRYLEQAKIGVAKRVVGDPVYNGNGTFDVTYEILVQNIGNTSLSQVQVVDDLTLTFVSPATFAVASVSSADFAVNSTYDGIGGTGDTDLLAGADTLLPHHEGRITLVVRVNPGGFVGPYNNTATGSGRSPGGTTFSDVSTDGDDPDTDTLGKTPADNLDASDDLVPTPVSFDLPASYTVTKTLVTTGDPRIGGQVVFSIHIENTGLRPITALPLWDTYNTTYLTYGFGTLYSIPASDDTLDNGTIEWADLKASFGKDLGIGEAFEVIVVFTAKADTTSLTPDGKTPNTATVHDAFAGAVALGNLSSEARVKILQPTGVTLAGFTAAATAGSVQVSWQTASETGIIGYNLLRQRDEAAGYEAVNAEPIIAQYAGQDRGGAYSFRDGDLPAGAYTYRLAAVRPDGSVETLGTIKVVIP